MMWKRKTSKLTQRLSSSWSKLVPKGRSRHPDEEEPRSTPLTQSFTTVDMSTPLEQSQYLLPPSSSSSVVQFATEPSLVHRYPAATDERPHSELYYTESELRHIQTVALAHNSNADARQAIHNLYTQSKPHQAAADLYALSHGHYRGLEYSLCPAHQTVREQLIQQVVSLSQQEERVEETVLRSVSRMHSKASRELAQQLAMQDAKHVERMKQLDLVVESS